MHLSDRWQQAYTWLGIDVERFRPDGKMLQWQNQRNENEQECLAVQLSDRWQQA